jgi:hypothetical protein
MSNEERLTAFLADYEALCRKHGLCVGACGCCNGPWVQTVVNLSNHVRHLAKSDLSGDLIAPLQEPAADDAWGYRSFEEYPFQMHLACQTRAEYLEKLRTLCPMYPGGCADLSVKGDK